MRMGGQATKKVSIPSQYRKYSRDVGKTIQGGDVSKAAEVIAPYVCMALGHQELAAGIMAFAEAYEVYQKTGDAQHALYCGTATFVAEATPGIIAGAALDVVQSQTGIQVNREIAPIVRVAMEDGISRLEKVAFKRVENEKWPRQTSSNI
jgi:hypothetical protein